MKDREQTLAFLLACHVLKLLQTQQVIFPGVLLLLRKRALYLHCVQAMRLKRKCHQVMLEEQSPLDPQ